MSNEDKNNTNKKLDTVKNAMEYIDTPAANFASWKIKDLGLQFLLFGIAEIQAKRVSKLLNRIDSIEDLLFDDSTLQALDPRGVLDAYKISTASFKDVTDYISKTRREMNWDEIGSRLNEMAMSASAGNEKQDEASLAKIANKLLEAMKPSVKND